MCIRDSNKTSARAARLFSPPENGVQLSEMDGGKIVTIRRTIRHSQPHAFRNKFDREPPEKNGPRSVLSLAYASNKRNGPATPLEVRSQGWRVWTSPLPGFLKSSPMINDQIISVNFISCGIVADVTTISGIDLQGRARRRLRVFKLDP